MEGSNLNVSNFNPGAALWPTNPNNVVNGTRKGLEVAVLGTVLGVAIIIAAPIKGGIDGYAGYGVLGATGGVILGTVVGAIGGTVIVVTSAVTCLIQTIRGLIRTPEWIYSSCVGKQWDHDLEEWVKYDLEAETKKLSPMTDDEFIMIVKGKGSAYEAYSVSAKSESSHGDNSAGEADSEAQAPRVKKNILDRELYDTLGIEPEATQSEIKKAYYLKARQNHPDRNPGDESAKANFQRIGMAYQVLSDEKTRLAYDTRGKASLDSKQAMDAGALYILLFGTDAFESIIGELSLAAQIKIMLDPATKPQQLVRFKQRKRELQCAITLLAKLELHMNGDEALFIEKAHKEAEELSESPLGGALLGVVGRMYVQRATSTLSSLDKWANEFVRAGAAISGTFTSLWHGILAGVSAIDMRNVQIEAEARQKAEDEKNGVTEAERKARDAASGPVNLSAMYGPNPTPEHKEKVRNKTKYMSEHLFGLLWQFIKSDIESTIKHACNKLLRDNSVTPATIEKRARALETLGRQYCTKALSEQDGLADFVTRMGATSGLYGKEPEPSNWNKKAGDGEEGGEGHGDEHGDTANPLNGHHRSGTPPGMSVSREYVVQLVSRVEGMSVRELKESIALLGGECGDCVEKADLRNRLNDLLAVRLFDFDENYTAGAGFD